MRREPEWEKLTHWWMWPVLLLLVLGEQTTQAWQWLCRRRCRHVLCLACSMQPSAFAHCALCQPCRGD